MNRLSNFLIKQSEEGTLPMPGVQMGEKLPDGINTLPYTVVGGAIGGAGLGFKMAPKIYGYDHIWERLVGLVNGGNLGTVGGALTGLVANKLLNNPEEEFSIPPYAVAGGSVGALAGGGKGIYDYMKKDQELKDVVQRGAGLIRRGHVYDKELYKLRDAVDNGLMSKEDYRIALKNLKKNNKNLGDLFDDRAIEDMIKDLNIAYYGFDDRFDGSFKADDKGKIRNPIYENKILRKHMRNNALKKLLLGSAAGLGGGALLNNLNTGESGE